MYIVNFLTNLDVSIYIYTLLVLFLIAGIILKEKPRNIKEYALGIKPFPTPVLVATMAATLIGGGSTIGRVGLYYNEGLLVMPASLLGYLGYIIFVRYILPKLDIYYGQISIASVLSKIYGVSIERLAGLVAYMYCFGALAMQVKAIGIIIEYALGYRSIFATILSFLIITTYSALGGVRSVIRTDVVQFLIFIIVLPTIAAFLLKENGGMYAVFEKTSWKVNANFSLISYISLFIFGLTPNISPIFIHRLLVGRKRNENKSTIYFTVLIQMLCSLFAIIVAAVAMSKYKGMDGNLAFFRTIGDVVHNNLSHALFAAAMLAVILSSADSLINTGAIIFVENVVKDKIKDVDIKLLALKIVTVISGLLVLFIALKIKNLLDIIWFIAQYYFSIIFIPFVGGLFVKDAKPSMFWASSITGFVSFTILKILMPEIGHASYLISLFMSLVAFLIAKYISKRSNIYNLGSKYKIDNYLEKIINQMRIPKDKLGYAIVPLAIFTLLTEVVTNQMNTDTMVFKIISAFIGLSFIFIDEILKNKRFLLNCYVLFSIWYCFPFLSSFIYYSLPNSNVAFANMIITCTFLAIIFSSNIVMFYVITGSIAGALVNVLYAPINLEIFIQNTIVLVSILLYLVVLSYFILKEKEIGLQKLLSELAQESSEKVDQYSLAIEAFQKHKNAKRLFLEKRQGLEKSITLHGIVFVNIKDLALILEDYLSIYELKNNVKIIINRCDKDIWITKPMPILYTFIISIAECLVGFKEKKIEIKLSYNKNEFKVRYYIPDFKFDMREVQKYINLEDIGEGILTLDLIKKIVKESNDMKLKIGLNDIKMVFSATDTRLMASQHRSMH